MRSKPQKSLLTKTVIMGSVATDEVYGIPGLTMYITIFAVILFFIIRYCKLGEDQRRCPKYLELILIATVGVNGIESMIWGALQMIRGFEISR